MAVRVAQQQLPPARYHEAPPSRKGAAMVLWMLLPALLAALVLGGFVLYAAVKPSSTPQAGTSGPGLSWGGTTLFTQAQVTSWLREHGASYQVWAQRHPAGVGRITHAKHHRAHPAKRHRAK